MPKRLLVVDDDLPLLRMLQRQLAKDGHEVVACARFEEAKQFLAREAPDALLTDIRLGAFNGLQLVVWAKQEYPNLPTIVLSAFDDPLLRREAEGWGATYLVKPVTRKQLAECLAGLLAEAA